MFAKMGNSFKPAALPLLRLAVGVVFFAHGAQKIFGGMDMFTGMLEVMGVPAAAAMAWLAALAEFLGGLALIFGVFVRAASVPLMVNMLVAVFAVHLKNGLFFTSGEVGGFEYPMVLFFLVLFFFAAGAGKFSVASVVSKDW
jgi:putative oxidoreductase